MDTDGIASTVRRALSEHVAPSIIKDLLVFQETDADGENILRFQVVIDKSGPDLTADKVFRATGIVRGALVALNDTRFPLLTFPSSDEIPEAAA